MKHTIRFDSEITSLQTEVSKKADVPKKYEGEFADLFEWRDGQIEKARKEKDAYEKFLLRIRTGEQKR